MLVAIATIMVIYISVAAAVTTDIMAVVYISLASVRQSPWAVIMIAEEVGLLRIPMAARTEVVTSTQNVALRATALDSEE